jgi:heptosyltransferase-2
VKVLIIRFSSLGDVVLATSAANYIRARKSEARISFLTKPVYAPLLKGHPSIDELWIQEGNWVEMARRIRRARFDAVLDLHGKPRSRILAALSGAPSRRVKNFGWNRRLRVWLKGSSLASPPDVVDRAVGAAAKLLGSDFVSTRPSLVVDSEALDWADEFLKQSGFQEGERLIAICPGAAWATKRWSAGYFAQAMGLLAEAGRRFLFVGDSVDEALAHRIIGYSRKGAGQTIVAAGKTDLPKLAALISRTEILLSNDSGPMHLASALGVPVLALFGPTVEAFGFFPRGSNDRVMQLDLSCRPCSVHGGDSCPLGTHECMEKIAPFDVAKTMEGMLRA